MTSEQPSDGRPRLGFLHGVRGLAALTVVLFHLTLNTGPESAGPIIRMLNVPLLHGYLAVAVFLVLSGFLLAMPVVTNGLALRDGVGGFLRRRAQRILPPYYAAYLLDMLFFASASRIAALVGRDPGGTVHHQLEIGYRWSSVVAHALLVHNMSHDWVAGMDAILWSIACEWQIYLVFAIVLVPLWRRFGLGTLLAACAGVTLILTEALTRGWCVYFLPWMIVIFGIGVAGATVVCGSTSHARAMRRWQWGVISFLWAVALCLGVWILDASVPPETMSGRMPVPYYAVSPRIRWLYDVLAALAAVSFIIWLARHDGHPGVAMRLRGMLDSRWLQSLSRFSYSLYLTHGIVLVFMARATLGLFSVRGLHWAVMMSVGMLLSLLTAYCFHRCFERPFMNATARADVGYRLPPRSA